MAFIHGLNIGMPRAKENLNIDMVSCFRWWERNNKALVVGRRKKKELRQYTWLTLFSGYSTYPVCCSEGTSTQSACWSFWMLTGKKNTHARTSRPDKLFGTKAVIRLVTPEWAPAAVNWNSSECGSTWLFLPYLLKGTVSLQVFLVFRYCLSESRSMYKIWTYTKPSKDA